MLPESHALGGASASTALNRAHPGIRRRHVSASAALIWRHCSKTFKRSAAALSSGDIEASTRSVPTPVVEKYPSLGMEISGAVTETRRIVGALHSAESRLLTPPAAERWHWRRGG